MINSVLKFLYNDIDYIAKIDVTLDKGKKYTLAHILNWLLNGKMTFVGIKVKGKWCEYTGDSANPTRQSSQQNIGRPGKDTIRITSNKLFEEYIEIAEGNRDKPSKEAIKDAQSILASPSPLYGSKLKSKPKKEVKEQEATKKEEPKKKVAPKKKISVEDRMKYDLYDLNFITRLAAYGNLDLKLSCNKAVRTSADILAKDGLININNKVATLNKEEQMVKSLLKFWENFKERYTFKD